jgi:hypothetical protein
VLGNNVIGGGEVAIQSHYCVTEVDMGGDGNMEDDTVPIEQGTAILLLDLS